MNLCSILHAMSHAPATEADRRAVRGFLDDLVFGLMPSEDFEEAMAGLPDGAAVSVTLVPKLGVEPTVERTEQAVARGHDAVPHVAPRFIEDALEEMGYSFEDVGITGYPTGHSME